MYFCQIDSSADRNVLLPQLRRFYCSFLEKVEMPLFPDINIPEELPPHCSAEDIFLLREAYGAYCQRILQAVVGLDLSIIGNILERFWQFRQILNYPLVGEFLSKRQLFALCELECVQKFIMTVDRMIYKMIYEILIPNVLLELPEVLRQCIYDFAVGLGTKMHRALRDYGRPLIALKMRELQVFRCGMTNRAEICKLSTIIRPILLLCMPEIIADVEVTIQSFLTAQLRQRAPDFLFFGCEKNFVVFLVQNFVLSLRAHCIYDWTKWHRRLVQNFLAPNRGDATFSQICRRMLYNFSAVSSRLLQEVGLTMPPYPHFYALSQIAAFNIEYITYLVNKMITEESEELIAAFGEEIPFRENSPEPMARPRRQYPRHGICKRGGRIRRRRF